MSAQKKDTGFPISSENDYRLNKEGKMVISNQGMSIEQLGRIVESQAKEIARLSNGRIIEQEMAFDVEKAEKAMIDWLDENYGTDPQERTAIRAIFTKHMGEKECECSPLNRTDFGSRHITLTHTQTCDCGGKIIEQKKDNGENE